MGFIIHFYIIFGTNLLTKGPVQIAVIFAYFSVSQKRNTKRNKTFVMIFLGPEDTQETWSASQKSHEAAIRVEGALRGAGIAPQPCGPLQCVYKPEGLVRRGYQNS